MKTAKDLQRTIKELLRDMLAGSIPAERAAEQYNAIKSDFTDLSEAFTNTDSASYIKGILYRHNVHNLSKATGLFLLDSSLREISFSGNRKLLPILEETALSVFKARRYGQAEKINLASPKKKEITCYHFLFQSGKYTYAVMSITSSLYFEITRFQKLCLIMEKLYRFAYDLPFPRLVNLRSMKLDTFHQIIAGYPPGTTAGIYSIPNIQQVLSHVSSADFWEIHHTIKESLGKSLPVECALHPVSPFRFLVINDNTMKKKFSITIRGIIVSFIIVNFRLDDPAALYHLIWGL